ncbi:MAG TPA: (4Fe-4S)-binding protein [Vicinamibacteria bacterium]|nr:(4Fe-4S)-binding protein [Vicinamibacteria bacterium]
MSDKPRHYTNEAIDITYDSSRCIHAEECVNGLPSVFDTARRPWIFPGGASADALAAVITKCPSGALHFTRFDGGTPEAPFEPATIVPTPRGPLYVRGRIELRSADGQAVIEETRLALCRCGESRNKPFCDNSHRDVRFADPGNLGAVDSNDGETKPS